MYEGKPLLDVMNDLRGRELAVIMQYMRHHYLVSGPDGVALAGEFREIAIVEMKHAEALAERIDYLGGDPTTKPEPIMGVDARTLAEMAAADRDSEADAIARYKEAVGLADAEGDVTTRKLFEDILGDEEDHHKTFSDMLG
ncbi:MAG TPA: ferritin-like domain-containing protein [Coriobacteriia bacterium]|nr:ferritin-like domain-containing protein [Coriobacteriia bacterium]